MRLSQIAGPYGALRNSIAFRINDEAHLWSQRVLKFEFVIHSEWRSLTEIFSRPDWGRKLGSLQRKLPTSEMDREMSRQVLITKLGNPERRGIFFIKILESTYML